MRLFLLSVNPQGEDMRFSWDGIEEMNRRLNIFWNVFRFPLPYMQIDDFDPMNVALGEVELETIDKWILSRLQTVKQIAKTGWESFRQDQVLSAILDFIVEDTSRYYIKVVRDRMWTDRDTKSKTAAYVTLHQILLESVILLAPFAPFIAEEIYQNLTKSEGNLTVHMCDFPSIDVNLKNEELEEEINIIRSFEETIARARQDAGRKLRWPILNVKINARNENLENILEKYKVLLGERVNSQNITLIKNEERGFEVKYSIVGNMNIIGPIFGKKTGKIIASLNEMSVDLRNTEEVSKILSESMGEEISITDEMVQFEEVFPKNITESTCEFGTVYIDIEITEDIESEGYAREIIRRVQEMRKEMRLTVDQEIVVKIDIPDKRILKLIMSRDPLIKKEVRCIRIEEGVGEKNMRDWIVEGIPMKIKVELN
jgi:isoleucyl-tRNA synthetase